MEFKAETQVTADLAKFCFIHFTPPFYLTSCDCFGPDNVKIGKNKTAKHYGVIFTCLNTRAVDLELAIIIRLLQRFFAIRG